MKKQDKIIWVNKKKGTFKLCKDGIVYTTPTKIPKETGRQIVDTALELARRNKKSLKRLSKM